jgi:hypothetical protein
MAENKPAGEFLQSAAVNSREDDEYLAPTA